MMSSSNGGARGRGRGRRRRRGEGNGFEEWGGYMNAKVQKLQDQYKDKQQNQESNIFNGVSIFVNGYTRPTSDTLKKLMKQHGGVFHHYYSRDLVTHIIAINLPNSKIANLTDKKVVHPNWILESISAGKLLPYENYLLYTARSVIQPSIKKFHQPVAPPTRSTDLSLSGGSLANKAPSISSRSSTANAAWLVRAASNASSSSLFSSSDDEYSIEVTHNESLEHPPEGSMGTDALKDRRGENISVSENNKQTSPVEPVAGPSSSTFRSPSKAGDPGFVSEFYTNSRLHHLSTWGAEFRAYVNKLQRAGNGSFPGREELRELVSKEMSVDIDDVSVLGRQTSLNRGKLPKLIMHIDMDSFFVSVGLRNQPDLIGKPVAVTHSRGKGITRERPGTDIEYEMQHWKRNQMLKLKKGPGKGETSLDLERNPDLLLMEEVSEEDEDEEMPRREENASRGATEKDDFHSMAEIASCSYEARKAGVKNGMFMGTARKLCPDLVAIPYDFEGYKSVSLQLYDLVASFTHDIEAVSCDEMLVDCTDLLATTGASPEQFASLLRKKIKDLTRCNASAGMGPSILIARMATRVAKPNGQFLVQPEDIPDFIKDLPISDIPGVGYRISNKLHLLDVTTCGDLQNLSLATLQEEFGPKTGQSLFQYCRGQDERNIRVERERKSVSAEINYGIRFTKDEDVLKFISELATEVHNRLSKIEMKGKTITLKLKVRKKGAPKETAKFLGHGICDNIAKSTTVPLATDDAGQIARECMHVLRPLNIPPTDYRGIGIQMSRLEAPAGRHGSVTHGNQSILNFTRKDTKHQQTLNTVISPDAVPLKRGTSHGSASTPDGQVRTGRSPDFEQISRVPSDGSVMKPSVQVTNTGSSVTKPVSMVTRTITNYTEPVAGTTTAHGDMDTESAQPKPLPPLPTLPIFSPSPTQRKFAGNQTRTPRQPSSEDAYLPSPSQVDPEVLRELPTEIRLQIEAEIKSKKRKKQNSAANSTRITRSQSTSSLHDSHDVTMATRKQDGGGEERQARARQRDRVNASPVAGCSHWSSDASQDSSSSIRSDDLVTAVAMETDKREEIVALPSYSQVDQECLNALPPELQEELRQAYAKENAKQTEVQAKTKDKGKNIEKKTVTTQNQGQIHPLMLMQARKSPQKSPKKSPRKQTSPQFKVPQGRPGRGRGRGRAPKKRLSPKKLNFLSSEDGEDRGRKETENPGHQNKLTEDKSEEIQKTELAPVPPLSTRPNLCGATTLAEVKPIIRAWVKSCAAPEQQDSGEFLQFLHDLMSDKNLETVFLLLKFLKRCLRQHEAPNEWFKSYKNIVDQTQNIVTAIYGAPLKM